MLVAVGVTAAVLVAPGSAAADPGDWTDTQPPKLDQDYWFEAVEPLSTDDAWAAGIAQGPEMDDGVLMRRHEGSWSHDALKGVPLYDIDALSGEDVWAVGYDHNERQPVAVNGGTGEWTSTPILPPDTDDETISQANGIAASASDDVWAAGTVTASDSATAFLSHWDGKEWTEKDLPVPGDADESIINSITVTKQGHVWAAGSVKFADGTSRAWMPHFDGSTWTDTPTPAPSNLVGVFDLKANGSEVWAGGLQVPADAEDSQPLLLHWDGSQWSQIDAGITDGIIEGISPDGHGGALAVGYTNDYQPILLQYRNGEVTSQTPPVEGDIVRFMDVAADRDFANLWIAGDHKTSDFGKGVGVHTPTGTG